MAATVKLALRQSDPVEVPALIVGGLAIHRPAYVYMPGQPVTYSDKGWSVTHIATGSSLTRWAPKDHRGNSAPRKAIKAWAEAIQAHDPEAWDEAGKMPFGEPGFAPELANRLSASIAAVKEA